MKQTVIRFQLTVIHCVIEDIFTNDDNLCANMDIHTNSFKPCLKDTLMTTDKLYQYGTLLYCAITNTSAHQKLFQYKNIDTVQLWIFQYTHNC